MNAAAPAFLRYILSPGRGMPRPAVDAGGAAQARSSSAHPARGVPLTLSCLGGGKVKAYHKRWCECQIPRCRDRQRHEQTVWLCLSMLQHHHRLANTAPRNSRRDTGQEVGSHGTCGFTYFYSFARLRSIHTGTGPHVILQTHHALGSSLASPTSHPSDDDASSASMLAKVPVGPTLSAPARTSCST